MALVHLLTPSTGDLRTVQVQCRSMRPEYGSWDRRAVTCAACLAPPRQPPHAPSGSRERELQELVRQACGLNHWIYYHTHRAQHSPAGFPDVTAVRGPRLLFAELKRPGAEPSGEQARWLEALQQVETVEVHLWRPGDLDQVMEVLR